VTDEDGTTETRTRLDQLRRRLYEPTATEADRREYAALAERLEQPRQSDPEPPVGRDEPADAPSTVPRARRRRPRPLVLGIGGAVVIAALAVIAVQTARSVSAPPTMPSATAWLSSPTAAPTPTPAMLTDDGRWLAAQQTSGGGSAVVRLDVRAAPAAGGRLVVAMSSSDPSPVGWLAERVRSSPANAGSEQVVAFDPPALRVGAAVPTTVSYTGAPPSVLVVQAPTGTGWSVTVAFAERTVAHD
jgi:hypothetical protein